MRPDQGRILIDGVLPVSWSLDTAGPLARTAGGCALLLDALSSPPHRLQVRSDIRWDKFTFIVAEDELFWKHTAASIATLVRAAVKQLKDLGAQVVSMEIGMLSAASRAAGIISLCESVAYHRHYLDEMKEQFGKDVLRLLERGEKHSGEEYALARETGRRWRKHLHELVPDRKTIIVTPTNPVYPPRINDPDSELVRYLLRHTFPFSLSGLPALSLPCGISEHNLPVGLQLVGRDVAGLLAIGMAFQQATNWHKPAPVLDNL